MVKTIKDRFDNNYESNKCDIFSCEDGGYIIMNGNYVVCKYYDLNDTIESLELTELETAQLMKDGIL